MKKVLIGLIVGLAVSTTSVAVAYNNLPYLNRIYQYNDEGGIFVFDDADNKCYVIRETNSNYGGDQVGISCVKQ